MDTQEQGLGTYQDMSVFREYGTQDFINSTEKKLGDHLIQISIFTSEKMDSKTEDLVCLTFCNTLMEEE